MWKFTTIFQETPHKTGIITIERTKTRVKEDFSPFMFACREGTFSYQQASRSEEKHKIPH